MGQMFFPGEDSSGQSSNAGCIVVSILIVIIVVVVIAVNCDGCNDDYEEEVVVEEPIEEPVEEYYPIVEDYEEVVVEDEAEVSGYIQNIEITVYDGGLEFCAKFHVNNSYNRDVCLYIDFHDENGNPIYCNEHYNSLILKKCQTIDDDSADCEWYLFARNPSFYDWEDDANYVYYDVYIIDEDGNTISRKNNYYCFEL